jgi:hypothetical protein
MNPWILKHEISSPHNNAEIHVHSLYSKRLWFSAQVYICFLHIYVCRECFIKTLQVECCTTSLYPIQTMTYTLRNVYPSLKHHHQPLSQSAYTEVIITTIMLHTHPAEHFQLQSTLKKINETSPMYSLNKNM